MAEVTCVQDPNAPHSFEMQFGTTTYQCVSQQSPVVLLNQGGMSADDFYALWPALVGLMVTGFIFKYLRLAVEGRFT